MTTIRVALQAFFESQSGTAAYGVLVVAFADFTFGTIKALTDGSFSLDEIAAFLRKHIMGRVAPIWAFLIFGWLGHLDMLTAAGVAGAALYVAETVGSIVSDWAPDSVKQKLAALTGPGGNPQPTD